MRTSPANVRIRLGAAASASTVVLGKFTTAPLQPFPSLGLGRDLPLIGSSQPTDTKIEDANLGDVRTTDANFDSVSGTIGNSPIIPETSGSWTLFRFLLALLVIAALVYFFFRHR